MCRLYGFRSNEPTKVECGLVLAQNALLAQSRLDAKGEAHPDGWGIGVYDDGNPRLERRATAAFEDLHFSTTAERVFASTVIAHVRQATIGSLTVDNVHPFVHGSWTFAHNGTLTGFELLRPRLEAEIEPLLRRWSGTTDSELVFYWILSRMTRQGIDLERPIAEPERLAGLLAEAVRELAVLSAAVDPPEPAKLNFLLTDGHSLAASRHGRTLYWVERRGVHDCEICGIPHVHHQDGTDYRAVVVASEAISDEAWREVPEGRVLLVDSEIEARLF